jgi:endonuclease III
MSVFSKWWNDNMKISSDYAKPFRTLQNKLKREFPKTRLKDPDTLPEKITDILILGILSMNEKYSNAINGLMQIHNEMVDLNELRVTPKSEIAEILQKQLANPERAADEIVKTLNEVFSRFDSLDLSVVKEKTKTEISKIFSELPGCSDYARSFMLLFGFDIPTMPLDELMLDYLVSVGALPPEADPPAAKGFVERQLKAAEIAPFYWQLRKACEDNGNYKKKIKK